jgi:hypothetical protein
MKGLVPLTLLSVMICALNCRAGQDTDHVKRLKTEFYRDNLCRDMLFKINTVSTSIKGNEYSMSELYKSLSTQKDFQKRAELDKYYKKSAEEISAKTVELSSLVSMYSTFKCDIGDAIEQIACPDGWSKKCKLD